MESHKDEKQELAQINERFVAYVHRVRQLKNDTDVRHVYQSIETLEDEMKSLKYSYECQVSQLQCSLEILTNEKIGLEKELMARKNNEAHLLDRLNVEVNKNAKFLHEITSLKTEIGNREQETCSLHLIMKQSRLECTSVEQKYEKTVLELSELRKKLDVATELQNETENKVRNLLAKIEFQEKFSNEQIAGLKARLEEYIGQMANLDSRVEAATRKEAELPEIIAEVRRKAGEELQRFQRDTENQYRETLASLQNQLTAEAKDLKHWKAENEKLNATVLDLKKNESALLSKVHSLEQQRSLLEQALQSERTEASRSTAALEVKLQQMQESMLTHLQEANAARAIDSSLRHEIDNLRRLLEEEERRLEMNLQSADLTRVDGAGSAENAVPESLSEGVNGGGEALHLNFATTDNVGGDQYGAGPEVMVDGGYVEPTTPRLPIGPILGPANSSREAVGPVRVQSAPLAFSPHPPPGPAQRERRQGSGAPRPGQTRSRPASSVTQGSSVGQGRDYFDEMFSGGHSKMTPPPGASALGDLKLYDIDRSGKYVRIWNTNSKLDMEIGSYTIQQNRGGQPVAVFRFPSQVKLPANESVCIWSGCNDPGLHHPPSDFHWPQQNKFGTGPDFTTILCKPNGEAVAWMTLPHRVTHDAYDQSINSTRSTRPGSEVEQIQQEQGFHENNKRLPELPIPPKTDPVYLIREKSDVLYSPQRHPHGTQPLSRVHPSTDTQRPLTWGNDNSSLVRQTRGQSTVPDPVPGELYASSSQQRVMGAARLLRFHPPNFQRSGSMLNRTPEILIRSSQEPPSAFQNPHSQIRSGVNQVRSMLNPLHQPPMPRPTAAAQSNW